MKKFFGFTLAEVLITLGIIGVVAALTIPTLISKYQKTQYVTQLKKAYTELNQGLRQLTNNYNCGTDLYCTGVYLINGDATTFGDEIVKYFKVLKNCRNTEAGCFTTSASQYIDGSGVRVDWHSSTNGYRFITADGMAFEVTDMEGYDCSGGETPSGTNFATVCGKVHVDINGPEKQPNAYGRDIFSFWIVNGRGAILYPVYGQEDPNGQWKNLTTGTINSCDNASGKLGGGSCAARIMEEGWEMNY